MTKSFDFTKYNEIFIEVYAGGIKFTKTIPVVSIAEAVISYNLGGAYANVAYHTACTITLSKTSFVIGYTLIDSSEITNAVGAVYGR